MSKSSKMLGYVNWRMRVTIADGRVSLGTFMAFDKHMNLVLSDTEEYRRVKGKKASEDKEEKRVLGLVLLRGENVVSLQADAPPPPKPRAALAAAKAAAGAGGPGMGRAAGRGLGTAPLSAPAGLSGSVKGMGGPAQSMMQPMAPVGRGAVMAAQPVAYGRGAPPSGAGSAAAPSPFPPMMGRGGPPMGMPPMGMGMPFNPMMMMGRGAPPPMGMPPFNPMMAGRGGPPPSFPPPPPAAGRGQ